MNEYGFDESSHEDRLRNALHGVYADAELSRKSRGIQCDPFDVDDAIDRDISYLDFDK